jgi:hypothetical protein
MVVVARIEMIGYCAEKLRIINEFGKHLAKMH